MLLTEFKTHEPTDEDLVAIRTWMIVLTVLSIVLYVFCCLYTDPSITKLNDTVKQYQQTHTDEKLTEIKSDDSIELPKNIQKGFYLDDNDDVQTVTSANIWDVVKNNDDVYVFSK